MVRSTSTEPSAGSPANPIPLPKEKKFLMRYYRGERLPSPMGGYLDVLGIREGDGGLGRVLFECNVSSLRFVLMIPRATRTETEKVKKLLEAGEDLTCPRHGPFHRLSKVGKAWVCPLCGVAYGKGG